MMYNCNNHKTIFSHNKGVPVANSIHHSNSIYNYFKSLKLGLFLSDVYLNHLMIIMVSVFLRGYRGKTIDFAEVSCMHRTTTAYFLNHGKWDDSALQDILKVRVIHTIYQEAYRSGKPIFCIVDDTIASHTKPAINQEGYKIMAYRSSIGYVNAIALPENTYQKEMNMWRLKLVVIILAAFGIFSSSVFYLYRLVCKPLNQFQKQMIQVGNGSLQEAEQEYGIKEFDDLMHEVEQMKEQIRNLIDDVVEKEKSIQRTEYEKLLYQINPHFLLNTLNSVQWMARMSRQDNITEFVQRLKRLLAYNLGKEGMQTTLRTEIDIVKDYIALEQMRYDFVIEMNVEEGRYLEQPTVRMLLQPLVENAIRYGLGDDEKITIQVFEDNIRGLAIITILDSGNGLTQEEINQINEPFDYDVKKMQHGNRGIGLRYVKAMLESFYEGETNLFVNCKKGYGTKITILIPIQEELRNKIKFTGSETEKEGMKK